MTDHISSTNYGTHKLIGFELLAVDGLVDSDGHFLRVIAKAERLLDAPDHPNHEALETILTGKSSLDEMQALSTRFDQIGTLEFLCSQRSARKATSPTLFSIPPPPLSTSCVPTGAWE